MKFRAPTACWQAVRWLFNSVAGAFQAAFALPIKKPFGIAPNGFHIIFRLPQSPAYSTTLTPACGVQTNTSSCNPVRA